MIRFWGVGVWMFSHHVIKLVGIPQMDNWKKCSQIKRNQLDVLVTTPANNNQCFEGKLRGWDTPVLGCTICTSCILMSFKASGRMSLGNMRQNWRVFPHKFPFINTQMKHYGYPLWNTEEAWSWFGASLQHLVQYVINPCRFKDPLWWNSFILSFY